jgi:hypothetical protein
MRKPHAASGERRRQSRAVRSSVPLLKRRRIVASRDPPARRCQGSPPSVFSVLAAKLLRFSREGRETSQFPDTRTEWPSRCKRAESSSRLQNGAAPSANDQIKHVADPAPWALAGIDVIGAVVERPIPNACE